MELLDNPDLVSTLLKPRCFQTSTYIAVKEATDDIRDFGIYFPDIEGSEDLKDALIMTNEEIEIYESLQEDAINILDDFNFRRVQSFEEFHTTLKNAIGEQCNEVTDVSLLQLLQYRRVSCLIIILLTSTTIVA